MEIEIDRGKLRIAFLKTGFFFSLLVWIYSVAMQIAHPDSTGWTFTHWFRVRIGYVAVAAFLISVVCFFLLQYFKKENQKN